MCLIIKPSDEPIVLEEDLEVYKVVRPYYKDGRYISPFMAFVYKLGLSYFADFRVISRYAYSDVLKESYSQFIEYDVDHVPFYGTVEEGLHTFANLEEAQTYSSTLRGSSILRCIIPAGSRAYKGKWKYPVEPIVWTDYVSVDGYASNALTVVEPVE